MGLHHRVTGFGQGLHRLGDLAGGRVREQRGHIQLASGLDQSAHQAGGFGDRAVDGFLGRPELFGDALNNENLFHFSDPPPHTVGLSLTRR